LVDKALGRAAFVVELAMGPAEAFGSLKAVLESISNVYDQYKVCFQADAPFKALLDNHIRRTLLPLRARSKHFACASPSWKSFLGSLQVMRTKQIAVKNY
jgi:hypothetical protein